MKEHLLTILENSRHYTLAVAEAMPEKDYTFQPVPDVFSFLQQVNHIAYGIEWWKENYIKGNKTDWAPVAARPDKKESIKYLDQAFESLRDAVTHANPGEDLVKGFSSTLDHITHHRAQAIVYLRSKGIAAPEYVY